MQFLHYLGENGYPVFLSDTVNLATFGFSFQTGNSPLLSVERLLPPKQPLALRKRFLASYYPNHQQGWAIARDF